MGSTSGGEVAGAGEELPAADEHQRGAEHEPSAALVGSQGQPGERNQAHAGKTGEERQVGSLEVGDRAADLWWLRPASGQASWKGPHVILRPQGWP
ncbi:MAG TPA: hypothetical protein VFF02_09480 [Anaeromyxobacteraceae bacterium]|nr:hypothetical protein [Anaeromyxobacteraceae bacterium]